MHLTVIRSGESNYLEFDVVRRKLANETVTSKMLDDSMAYIDQEFDDVTLDQFTEALDNARSEGMEGLIIDLRGNPGGNLSTVCDICRELLPKGLIVYTRINPETEGVFLPAMVRIRSRLPLRCPRRRKQRFRFGDYVRRSKGLRNRNSGWNDDLRKRHCTADYAAYR